MLLPVKWLRDFVDIDVNVKELSDKLTDSGSHIESIISQDKGIENVVVGKILDIREHENADKLVVTSIDIGREEPIQIVTGAKNISLGDLVPVALVGAKLAGDLKIKKGKLRGIDSFGMLCSFEELGFSDGVIPKEASDGILILDEDFEVGQDINKALGLEDYVLEIEITPNRPDCLSISGLARETAASFGLDYREPSIEVENEVEAIGDYLRDISIETDKCNRYYGRVIKDVVIKPSPMWLQMRLIEAGVRPINNLVDITNYVMLEFGQPLHAFDLDSISQREIVVREAREGEKLTTLDGQDRQLESGDIVIADREKILGIAGVMGGLDSEITGDTKNVVLESANFKGRPVRMTSRRLNLMSEASNRYSRDIDPNLCKTAGDRVCQLVEELGVGRVVRGNIDIYRNKRLPEKIVFKPENINRRLDTKISSEDMVNYLENLGLVVEKLGDSYEVTVPTFRMDLKMEVDLMEEIGRLYGFHNIEPKPLNGDLTRGEKPLKRLVMDRAKGILSSIGYNEILTYSFISPKSYDKLALGETSPLRESIRLINPLGEDYSIMRRTLISNLLETMSRNYHRNIEAVSFYEIGNVFLEEDSKPKEYLRLVLGSYGSDDFYALKESLNITLSRLGLRGIDYIREEDNPSFHPGRTGKVLLNGEEIGVIGEVHPDVLKNYEIKKRAYVAEVDFEAVIRNSNKEIIYKELPKYPAMSRDLALIVDETVLAGQIEDLMRSHGGDLVEKVELFDVYTGDQIPEGKKSMAYSIVYRSYKGTLREEEVNKIQKDLIEDLEKTFGARLRS